MAGLLGTALRMTDAASKSRIRASTMEPLDSPAAMEMIQPAKGSRAARIFTKLDVRDRVQAVIAAYDGGLTFPRYLGGPKWGPASTARETR
jgi:hypothetical protein